MPASANEATCRRREARWRGIIRAWAPDSLPRSRAAFLARRDPFDLTVARTARRRSPKRRAVPPAARSGWSGAAAGAAREASRPQRCSKTGPVPERCRVDELRATIQRQLIADGRKAPDSPRRIATRPPPGAAQIMRCRSVNTSRATATIVAARGSSSLSTPPAPESQSTFAAPTLTSPSRCAAAPRVQRARPPLTGEPRTGSRAHGHGAARETPPSAFESRASGRPARWSSRTPSAPPRGAKGSADPARRADRLPRIAARAAGHRRFSSKQSAADARPHRTRPPCRGSAPESSMSHSAAYCAGVGAATAECRSSREQGGAARAPDAGVPDAAVGLLVPSPRTEARRWQDGPGSESSMPRRISRPGFRSAGGDSTVSCLGQCGARQRISPRPLRGTSCVPRPRGRDSRRRPWRPRRLHRDSRLCGYSPSARGGCSAAAVVYLIVWWAQSPLREICSSCCSLRRRLGRTVGGILAARSRAIVVDEVGHAHHTAFITSASPGVDRIPLVPPVTCSNVQRGGSRSCMRSRRDGRRCDGGGVREHRVRVMDTCGPSGSCFMSIVNPIPSYTHHSNCQIPKLLSREVGGWIGR